MVDFSSPDPLVLTVTLTTSYKTRLWSNLLSHLEAADAGVEGIVGAGHVLQFPNIVQRELLVASLGPEDVPDCVMVEMDQGLDVLEAGQLLILALK